MILHLAGCILFELLLTGGGGGLMVGLLGSMKIVDLNCDLDNGERCCCC